jgi:type I restriction enzyme R subunit
MYFAIYQSLAKDERRPGLFKEYAPDFFDLIVVDECHRDSARDESNWREILEYFEPAFQLGMTATPLRDDNRDTYAYFGEPIYTYSLRQGIDDGFLAS